MSNENKTAAANAGNSEVAEPVRDGTENYYSGAEPFFGFFTQTQVLLGALRLTIDSQVKVSTSDLGTQMESVRRGFQHSGNLTMAIQDVARLSAQYGQRVQLWEREVQGLTSLKRGLNGSLIQRLKSEIARVRGQTQAIDRSLVKLKVKLHQMTGEESESGDN